MAPEPTYVLVVRLWHEPGAAVRVRLRGQVDPGGALVFDRAAASSGDVVAAVGEWLELVTPQ